MTELITYRPSGRFGVRAIAIALVFGLPLASAMGYGLAWGQFHAHGFIASTICVFLAVVVTLIVFGLLTDHARSRHVLANTAGAVALLLCMMSVRWWHAEHLPGEALVSRMISTSPANWFGDALLALLEMLPIAVFALIIAREQARAPFSEQAQQWGVKAMRGELWAESAPAAQVRKDLGSQGVALLLNLPRAAEFGFSPMASVWRTVDVQGYWVEADEQSRWLTIQVKTHERDDNGKIKVSSETVVEHWQVSPEAYLALSSHLDGVALKPNHENEKQTDISTGSPVPNELEPAFAAMEAEQHAACLALAQAHRQHPDRAVQADAWRMCALSLSRMERWEEAFDHFHHLFELEPSTLNALQLASTSAMAGELMRAEAWFSKATEVNAQHSEMPPARMRTNYLSALEQAGEFGATAPHLDWLAQGYMAMSSTDAQFLWQRGFPVFSEFLRKSQQLLGHVMPREEMTAWYARMTQALDEEGRQMLSEHIASLPAAR